jgi:DNA-binding NarL/FixJ family response regulator
MPLSRISHDKIRSIAKESTQPMPTNPVVHSEPAAQPRKEAPSTDGCTNKEASSALGISHRTLENHRAKIMLKLSLNSQAGLIRFEVRQGIVKGGFVVQADKSD